MSDPLPTNTLLDCAGATRAAARAYGLSRQDAVTLYHKLLAEYRAKNIRDKEHAIETAKNIITHALSSKGCEASLTRHVAESMEGYSDGDND